MTIDEIALRLGTVAFELQNNKNQLSANKVGLLTDELWILRKQLTDLLKEID